MDIDTVGFRHHYVPALESASAPTLLLLHGTGGTETDLLALGAHVAPDANRLGVRGKVLEGGAPRHFRRLAEGVFDQEDLRLRTEDLADFIDLAAEIYGFDPTRVVAVGFSNGANIAGSLLFRRPDLLAGAILLRPMVPFLPESPPDLSGVPILIEAGISDPVVPMQETIRLASLLQEFGADVTVAYQQSAHDLTRADVNTAREWWQLQLSAAPEE